MATENLPISGLWPLTGALTPNDLLVISQEKVEGWKSFNVEVSKFVDLVIEGMNDGSVFMRKVYNAENSGLTGSGVLTDALSLDWAYLRTQFAPINVGADYVPTTTRVIAGNGLVGGGELNVNRTLALGTPSTITSATTNNVTGDTHTHEIEKASTSNAGVVKLVDTVTSTSTTEAPTARVAKQLNDSKAEKSVTINAGNGLTGGGDLSGARTLSMGAPSSITENSTNSVTDTSHTHAIEKASTASAGIVKLNDTLTSASITEAPTARQAKALNDAKAEKNITISVGWGLTGGGNLSANRNIDLNLAQLDTRYAASGVGSSYTPLTRAITAGTGLIGGGDFTANRSFSVNFGTAANTVAMGNDSRILNGQTAFGWGNHVNAGYLKTVALRASSGLLGTGVDAENGLGLDYNAIDARYLAKTGGTIAGDLTVTGKLTASNLDQGIPTGTVMWFNCSRATLPDGFVPLDGQLGNRADFPDLWAMINAGRLNRVSDASWNLIGGDTTRLNYRSSYSTGTSTSNFRFPDLNGVSSNSLQSPVLRGDGYRAGGQMLGDGIRNIVGTAAMSDDNAIDANSQAACLSGAFYYTGRSYGSDAGGKSIQPIIGFDAARVVPVADENRMNCAFGIYAVKARGGTNSIPAAGAPASLLANVFNGSQRIVGNLEVTGTVNFANTSNLPALGAGQTYQNMRPSRVTGTTYYNTTSRPIWVSIDYTLSDSRQVAIWYVDGFAGGDYYGQQDNGSGSWRIQISFIVPAGSSYRLDGLNGAVTKWTELR